jgi:two-component system, OmpR family, phosphate regulon response regulator PhoB
MKGHGRVLAIEDDRELGYLYESFLGEEGYEVLVAHDADEAMRLLQAHPDVVILDLMLPGTDGYALLRRIRSRPETRRLPVVVVSASLPPGRQHVAGADAVVHKPFEFNGLLRAIEGAQHHGMVGRVS